MSNRKKYNKNFHTIEEQINLLKKRGLNITKNNYKKIYHYLNHINYYHLSAYFKVYQKENNMFVPNVVLDDVLNLYFFDRKLRLLFMNAIERIEKSFKTQIVYSLSLKYGPHYLIEEPRFHVFRDKIISSLENTKEPFIKDFRSKYIDLYPPLWILIEVFSFGDVLNLYGRCLKLRDKKNIASSYDMKWEDFYSWLDNLREIRNICAHYSRLWNRKITKKLKYNHHYENLTYNNYIFDSIFITKQLLSLISPQYRWIESIKKIITRYNIDLKKMGFPDDWQNIL